MNKLYLVYGNESYFIDKFINSIIEQYKEFEFITYTALEDNVSKVIDDLNTVSLFSSKKVILLNDCYFLTAKKYDIEHKIDDFLTFISGNNENILILSLKEDSIDKRKKIVKEIEKNAEVKVFNKLNESELIKYIKDYCKNNGYNIDIASINLIIEKLNDDLYIITNELDKLFLYKDNDKNITVSDIETCISKMINANIFDFIDAITKRNIDKALELYDDLILINEEEIKLIIILANQFRLIYQTKEMYKDGYSEYDISKLLEVHPYRVKLAKNIDVSSSDALKYLRKLGYLDQQIKTGEINKEEGLKKFILDL
ncbi:MAG TPA: DNA polymerase III subunit delta [Bacilli bacterium]|nr:DNA polymerase III subunit delta [Bacilli bacterium]